MGLLEKYAIFSDITFWRASACYTTILCPYPTGPARQVVKKNKIVTFRSPVRGKPAPMTATFSRLASRNVNGLSVLVVRRSHVLW